MDKIPYDVIQHHLVARLDVVSFLRFAITATRSMLACRTAAEQNNIWGGGYDTMHYMLFGSVKFTLLPHDACQCDDIRREADAIFLRRIKDAFTCYCGAVGWSVISQCECWQQCNGCHSMKPTALLCGGFCATPRIYSLCAHYYLLVCHECGCGLAQHAKEIYIASERLNGRFCIKWIVCAVCRSHFDWRGMERLINPQIGEMMSSDDLLRVKIYRDA